jgi:hypothetical protein
LAGCGGVEVESVGDGVGDDDVGAVAGAVVPTAMAMSKVSPTLRVGSMRTAVRNRSLESPAAA